MEKSCESCFYSRPSLNDDLVVCTYLDDIISSENGRLQTKTDEETAKYFIDLTNFSGDVFEAYADTGKEEPELKICVSKESWCGKYTKES